MTQDDEHLIATTGEHEQVRCALVNAAQWFRDYEQQHLAKDTSEGREKALTNAARAILCEEAAVLAGQLADEADRLQSAPKPSLPSREDEPTDEMALAGLQTLPFGPSSTAHAKQCYRAMVAARAPSPLSDRVERLEQALEQITTQAEDRAFAAACVEPNERALVIMGKWFQELQTIARAALGDGERHG